MDITTEILKQPLNYDEETGIFTWVVNRGSAKKGMIAGTLSGGYMRIQICGKIYASHRLAWVFVYGVWPKNDIDHINCVKSDNRICNLREATRSENQQNFHKAHLDSASGLLGASHYKGRWIAQIQFGGRKKYLGHFSTKEEAHTAYLIEKRKLHPFGEL